jgi:hypothetical protein
VAQRLQDAGRVVVVPVVRHAGEQIQLGRGWGNRQIPGLQQAAVGNPLAFQDGLGVLEHVWLPDHLTGTVAVATPASERRDWRHENPPPSPHAIPPSAFAGFRFPPDVIVLAVRWYLRFGLSYRDLEELLAERGIQADHVTIYRWVLRFTPLLADAARPSRHSVGNRRQIDET